MTTADTPAATVRRPTLARRAFHFVRNCLALVGLLLVIYVIGFDLSVMQSGSMTPTLLGEPNAAGNDRVLCEKVSYWFRNPQRYDIVRFRNKDAVDVMKRVAGLPGENVAVRDGFLVINGQPLPRPPQLNFVHYYGFAKLFKGKECPCGPRGYFVLGDDSRDSQDSRYDGP